MPFYSDFPTRIAFVWFFLHLVIYVVSKRNFRSVVKDQILYQKNKKFETANAIIAMISLILNCFIYFYFLLFFIMLFVVPVCIYQGEESAWNWIHVIPFLEVSCP
jgi:flagellar biosynthesis protein FlhB